MAMDNLPQEQLAAELESPTIAETTTVKRDINTCPACKRKLLSHTSVLCNWCGAKIDDPDYQEQAAQARQSQDQLERERIEALIQEEARYGTLGRLRRRAKTNPGAKPNDRLIP
jgi:ribosomal protein L37AE/L43A